MRRIENEGMTRRLGRLVGVALLAVLASGALAAQIKSLAPIRPDRSNVLESQIPLGFDHPPIAGSSFRNTTAIPLPKGSVLPSRAILGPLGMDRMLSLRQYDFTVGSRRLRFPVISLMRCSNFPNTGEFVQVVASTTAILRNLKSGETLQEHGYRVEARRALRSGEKLPSLRILFQRKKFIFSLEATPGPSPKPVLSIAKDLLTEHDRAIAMEAWRLAQQSAEMGVPN
jgi:hypothetical protein